LSAKRVIPLKAFGQYTGPKSQDPKVEPRTITTFEPRTTRGHHDIRQGMCDLFQRPDLVVVRCLDGCGDCRMALPKADKMSLKVPMPCDNGAAITGKYDEPHIQGPYQL
jgi:hypothetical protein